MVQSIKLRKYSISSNIHGQSIYSNTLSSIEANSYKSFIVKSKKNMVGGINMIQKILDK